MGDIRCTSLLSSGSAMCEESIKYNNAPESNQPAHIGWRKSVHSPTAPRATTTCALRARC
eukprot:scaffold34840_cov63-Phaeocystis_antarctica.AAC.3